MEEPRKTEAAVFDQAAALARVEGDEELLAELAGLFLEEAPGLLAQMREALAAGRRAPAGAGRALAERLRVQHRRAGDVRGGPRPGDAGPRRGDRPGRAGWPPAWRAPSPASRTCWRD